MATADRLDASDIVHVIADGSQPALYHWLYVRGGYLVKLDVKSGEIIESKALPPRERIEKMAGVESAKGPIGFGSISG